MALTASLAGCWTMAEWRERVVGPVWVAEDVAGGGIVDGFADYAKRSRM